MLRCHYYLGLSTAETTENKLIWLHNSTVIVENDNFTIQDVIVSDVTKESRLILQVPTFTDSGKYTCSTQNSDKPKNSTDVEIRILIRKFDKGCTKWFLFGHLSLDGLSFFRYINL